MNNDFTIEKYIELCNVLKEKDYSNITMSQLIENKDNIDEVSKKFFVIRHDVDRKANNSLKMAELENKLGIRTTYYFRYPYTFKPSIVMKIKEYGHEIGYHYEVLSKTRGDYKKAIDLFAEEIGKMRKTCDIDTICMHGSPLSKHDNRDLWKKFDFRDYDLLGEAYLSLLDVQLNYFTDTGRNWNNRNSIRDHMPGSVKIDSTDDLIQWLDANRENRLYFTVHPERWSRNNMEWVVNYLKDSSINVGKKLIVLTRSS